MAIEVLVNHSYRFDVKKHRFFEVNSDGLILFLIKNNAIRSEADFFEFLNYNLYCMDIELESEIKLFSIFYKSGYSCFLLNGHQAEIYANSMIFLNFEFEVLVAKINKTADMNAIKEYSSSFYKNGVGEKISPEFLLFASNYLSQYFFEFSIDTESPIWVVGGTHFSSKAMPIIGLDPILHFK